MSTRASKNKKRKKAEKHSQQEPRSGQPAQRLILPLLILATLTVYGQVAGHEFIDLDTNLYVFDNEHVKAGVTLESVKWAFTTTTLDNWHPLTWLSYMIDSELFGVDPRAYHLINLLFHVVNSALLFLVLRGMTGAVWRSASVVALFALHPLHVESVAWVAERKDVLSTALWLVTLWLYTRYVRTPGLGRFLPVVVAFALGLMAKPMLVTLPFVLLLLDYWPLRRPDASWPALILEKTPLLALSLVSSVVTILAQTGALNAAAGFPLTLRLENSALAYVGYLGKTFWPQGLAIHYPYPHETSAGMAVAAALILVGLSLLSIRLGRRRPYLPVGWLWFLGTLVPVIGLIQVGDQAMADRYTYVPLIGLFIALVWGASELAAAWRIRNAALAALALSVLAVLSVLTWFQVGRWKNTETLFRHAVEVTHENPIARWILGVDLTHREQLDEAVLHLEESIRIRLASTYATDMQKATTYNSLGVAYELNSELNRAYAAYSEALRLAPGNTLVLYNLAETRVKQGIVRQERGRLAEAVAFYAEAVRLWPIYAPAHLQLGIVAFEQGKFAEALQHYQRALDFDDEDADNHFYVGQALARAGQLDAARIHYAESLRLEPTHDQARQGLRVLSMEQPAPEEDR